MIRILTIDPSLTAAGVCELVAERDYVAASCQTLSPDLRDVERLEWFREWLAGKIVSFNPQIVAFEGYAFGRINQMAALGELGGVLKLQTHNYGKRILIIAPSSLKQWAVGKGNASKEAVCMAAARQFPEVADNNQADARWLADITLHFVAGRAPTNEARRKVLDTIGSKKKGA